MEINHDTYTCARCHGVFEKTRTDEEAMDEAEEIWGTRKDMAVVCDVCWREMMGLPALEGEGDGQ